MGDAINCTSCGAPNQLPDGRNSMFCAFCGMAIEKKPEPIRKSRIKKSKIIDGELAYVNRGLTSLSEVIDLYSDTELETITTLDLSDNRLTDLNGLSRFSAVRRLILAGNGITEITELPGFSLNPSELITVSNDNTLCPHEIEIDLSRNPIIEISDASAATFNRIYVFKKGKYDAKGNYLICLNKNPDFKNESLSKINFEAFANKCSLIVTGDNPALPKPLELKGFKNKGGIFEYDKTPIQSTIANSSSPNSFQLFFGKLSILDWAALVAPYILAIVIFKYNKDDKTSTIGFLDFLVVFLVIAVIIRFYPFFSQKIKTGRSFESKHGKFDEYTTVEGKVNTEHGWWIVSLIHIVVIVLVLKVHGFGASKIESDANRLNNTESNQGIAIPQQDSIHTADSLGKVVAMIRARQDSAAQADYNSGVANKSSFTPSIVLERVKAYYQAVSRPDFDASLFFSRAVYKYINERAITPMRITELVSQSRGEFTHEEVTLKENTFAPNGYGSNGINLTLYRYWIHYKCFRTSKQKTEECDVLLEVGMDEDNYIASYSELKMDNLTFSEVSNSPTENSNQETSPQSGLAKHKIDCNRQRGCISGNCMDGQGTFVYLGEGTYSGEWKNGRENGIGTYTRCGIDGDGYIQEQYVGDWVNGERSGQGTTTFTHKPSDPIVERYIGGYYGNDEDGEGTYYFISGGVYKGDWKKSMYNGYGTFTYPNGEKRSGEWKDNKFVK